VNKTPIPITTMENWVSFSASATNQFSIPDIIV
jgi:hypothetical protein